LRIDPALAIAHAGLSVALSELNANAKAQAAIERARVLSAKASEHDRAHNEARALQVTAEGSHQNASLVAYRNALDAALQKFPADVELWLQRGVSQSPDPADRGQGSVEASVPFYEKALGLSPNHFAAQHYLTHAHENARRAALNFDRPGQVAAYAETFRRVVATTPRRTPAAKRALDVVLSGVGLLLSSPVWLTIAAAVKLQDGGPVFYGQQRVGRGGRSFKSWKFRSMVPDSDRRFGPRQAAAGDERITRVGRVLRATAMDELPQLWNIFRGDMSFVGPRALMPRETEVNAAGTAVPIEAIPGYAERHRVVPGLTGIAQIYADRDIPRRQKFRYDRLYIRKQSFWLDLRLIALSFWITFRGRWERRGTKL
jgi:lipopolysaccharide/colanic/teichoic acid biosynthesis glycosyltransferase